MNFEHIEYLKHGNTKQRQVYQLLTKHSIMSSLAAFEPILVGTIPINIDTDRSDIDIICYASDLIQFAQTIREFFQRNDDFKLWEYQGQESNAVVVNFCLERFEIEIFGQDVPTRQQLAYRHMLIEHRLLQEKGERFRQDVIALKRKGVKTEPAFAKLPDLKGDPYVELLRYEVDNADNSPGR